MRSIQLPKLFQWPFLGKILCFFLVYLGVVSCSGETDDNNLCTLSCADAIPAAYDYKIVPRTEELALSCSAVGQADGTLIEMTPQTLQFVVYNGEEDTSSDGGEDSESSASTSSLTTSLALRGTSEKTPIPVPNISVTPFFNGQKAANISTHADLQNDVQFLGVKTGRSEWCTDSCGVFTIQVVPTCLAGGSNQHSLSISSGAVAGETVITVDGSTTSDSE